MLLEVDAVEEMLHVGERVDRDALAAHLAFAHRMVAVVAHQRRHVEVGRQPGLALADQVFEAPVRVLGRAETGDLAHRPEPPAIHRRVGTARDTDTGPAARGPREACRRDRVRCRRASTAARPACGTPLAARAGARGRTRPRSSPTRRPARRARVHRGRDGRTSFHALGPVWSCRSSRFAAACGPIVRASRSASNPATWPPRWRAKRSRRISSPASSSLRSLISRAAHGRSLRSHRARRGGRRSPRSNATMPSPAARQVGNTGGCQSPLRRDRGPSASMVFRSVTRSLRVGPVALG